MLKRPPLTLLRKGRPKVTNELLLGFVLGAWSAALLALMVLLARAERSLATARGSSKKRPSLSGSAYEYRRLLAAAAVGCISWMILAAISYGLARLLGWRL